MNRLWRNAVSYGMSWLKLTVVTSALLLLVLRGERWSRTACGLPVAQELLWTAVTQGNVTELRQALRQGADVHQPHRQMQVVPLEAGASDPRVVRELLRHGADPDRHEGQPPLICAILAHQGESVRELLAAGAAVDPPDGRSRSPLVTAIRQQQREIIAALTAAGADWHALGSEGISPLQAAAEWDGVALMSSAPNARQRSPW